MTNEVTEELSTELQEIKVRVVGVQLRNRGKLMQCDPRDLILAPGDWVFVDSEGGAGLAQVSLSPRYVPKVLRNRPLPKVQRKLSPEELRKREAHQQMEREAFQYCSARISQRRLAMKLVDVEVLLDESKMVFSFTADDRIDFRELVRDIAYKYRAKIEMRQIGVRDAARVLDGYGPCGRPLCCSSFLTEFGPVSIRMARDQDLVLNPAKTSGLCGRLKCCIAYEHDPEKRKARSSGKEDPGRQGEGAAPAPAPENNKARPDRKEEPGRRGSGGPARDAGKMKGRSDQDSRKPS